MKRLQPKIIPLKLVLQMVSYKNSLKMSRLNIFPKEISHRHKLKTAPNRRGLQNLTLLLIALLVTKLTEFEPHRPEVEKSSKTWSEKKIEELFFPRL